MRVLLSLAFLKGKAKIRNLFQTKSSAIFTILCALGYVGIMVMMLTLDKNPLAMMNALNQHGIVMLGVGYTALMVFSTMFQKRKALLFAEDSFYLFKGPFTQRQILLYASLATLTTSFLFGLLTVFVVVAMSMQNEISFGFMGMLLLTSMLSVMIWVQFNDTIYLYSLVYPKYKPIVRWIAIVLLALTGILLLWEAYVNDFAIMAAGKDFLMTDTFYFFPVFGQMKLALIAFLNHDLSALAIGLGALVLLYILTLLLFIRRKPDFYEYAMLDSEEFSQYYKAIRSGKKSSFDMNAKKVKQVKHTRFYRGAGAVFSKNLLMMKKGRSLLRGQELLIIAIYFLMAIVLDNSFEMFAYMLYVFLFILLQDCDLLKELKNYQIYLIPDSAGKKLLFAMLPSLIKISLIACVSILIGGIYFGVTAKDLLLNMIQMEGYILVFLSASALSVRILKSRATAIVENMIRMIILILCALPGIFLTFFMLTKWHVTDVSAYEMVTYGSLALNFVLSLILFYFSKNMMNGCDIQSE